MTNALAAALFATSKGSLDGGLTFPEVVRALANDGVESYRVDLLRREETGYLPSAVSAVIPMNIAPRAVAAVFSPEGLQSALSAVQARAIDYRGFLERIADAGVSSYLVFISGRRAIYLGRDGECVVEPFPSAL